MVNMNLTVFSALVLFHTVFALKGFGPSYLKNSTKLCHQWSCVSEKLGLQDTVLPSSENADLLMNLVPQGPWKGAMKRTLAACFGDSRPRRYVNTCHGQALLHCVVDQLIQNCPDDNWRKDDACAPVSTLAGFKFMFSQSRYGDIEKNLPTDSRPAWFLKNYFNSKCCDLPEIVNSTVRSECGFSSLMFYHEHPGRHDRVGSPFTKATTSKPTTDHEEKLKVVDINASTKAQEKEPVKDKPQTTLNNLNPMDCCDISPFIEPAWASECGFELSWTSRDRLVEKNASACTEPPTTTTAKPRLNDVKLVPLSCEQETCVFKHLDVISESGSVRLDPLMKLLDNMTEVNPLWAKAKGRVITNCITKPSFVSEHECEINKVLACTFDVLSENCPHAPKEDPCKHSKIVQNGFTCQISSSKYRPKNRRLFCGIPNIVNHEILSQCGVTSISRLEYVTDPPVTVKSTHKGSSKYSCKETSKSMQCLLNKMAVQNKYGFMDYFRMKDRIRLLTNDSSWASLSEVYLSTFTGMPLYGEHCSSPRKLMNVVDAMLTTCPTSKRKHSLECNRMFTDMMNTPAIHLKGQPDRQKLDQLINRIHHIFLPLIPKYFPKGTGPMNFTQIGPKSTPKPKIIKNPPYDFGILDSKDVPPITVIDLKRNVDEDRKPLVLLPVYLRIKINRGSTHSDVDSTVNENSVTPLHGERVEMADIVKP